MAVALNRSTSDFTEEERQMMQLFCPHLVRAFHNNQLIADLTIAAQANDRGYMIVDQSGRIRFSTLSARIYVEQYDDSVRNEVLPERIRAWFLTRLTWHPTVETQPVNELVLYQQTGRLIVELVPSPTPQEFHLAFQEKREPNDATALQKLGLTCKEAEVLFWIAKGKRNGEIGQILAISLRTIEKHVEHILLKLSVETRTSAGALVMDYFTDRGI